MRLIIACLFILLSLPPLYAQDSYEEFERKLSLSDSQRSQVEGIKKKYSNEWSTLKNESMQRRLELNEMNRDPTYRRDRAEAAQRELHDIEMQRRQLYQQYRQEVGRALNEQQRGKYEQFITRERERRRSAGPMRPGGGINPPRSRDQRNRGR
jgi:hypothetical protein